MASINFGGLASGLDTNAIIDALVDVARNPIRQLEQKKSNYNRQSNIISDLSSKLSTLRTTMQQLDTAAEFKAYAAKSSDEDKLTAVAGTGAAPGTYTLRVDKVAQSERTYSNTFTAKDQTGLFGTGTLTIAINGSTNSFSIAGTDTLASVAEKINSNNSGVTASVVYNGTNYRLSVAGNNTGTANAITFSGAGATTLGLDVGANQVQAAGDAEIYMDSVTFKSSTNQFSSVIPGVTLNVQDVSDPDTINLTVGLDTDAIEKKIAAFVKDYNEVAKVIQAQSTYSGSPRQDSLIGDASIRGIDMRLNGILSGAVAGVATQYNSLSLIGITSNRDGSLTLNSSKLKTALTENLSAVTSLFTYTDNNASTDNDGVAVRLDRAIDEMVRSNNGTLTGRKDGLSRSVRSLDDRISTLNRNLETYEQNLRNQYTSLETVMSRLRSQGSFLSAL